MLPANTSVAPSAITVPVIEKPLTAQQLAEIVPLHPVTLLRWARENRIPHRRLGPRRVVFMPSQIQHWLATGSGLYPETVSCAASTQERQAA
ncbi:helix-turn-helix domain-containing protein [Terriglobus roseus]